MWAKWVHSTAKALLSTEWERHMKGIIILWIKEPSVGSAIRRHQIIRNYELRKGGLHWGKKFHIFYFILILQSSKVFHTIPFYSHLEGS